MRQQYDINIKELAENRDQSKHLNNYQQLKNEKLTTAHKYNHDMHSKITALTCHIIDCTIKQHSSDNQGRICQGAWGLNPRIKWLNSPMKSKKWLVQL